MEAILLTPKLEEAYQQFLLSNPHSLVYATVPYRDFLCAVAGGEPCYWLALNHGEITGVLPYFRTKHPALGQVVNSLPWYGSHGGCTRRDGLEQPVHRLLLERYRESVSEPGMLSATLILSPFENAWVGDYEENLKPCCTEQRIGQITHLPDNGQDVEKRLLELFLQKTRNLVRKSLKQGFELVIADEELGWRFLYETHKENMEAIGGRAKPWEHFMALRKHIPENWRKLLIATWKGQPVAALMLLYFNLTVEYITPVIKHDFRPLQPLSFLIWHGMLRAIADGYRYWNWGGTWVTQESLHHFKAGWGSQDYPYSYLINASDRSVHKIKSNLADLQGVLPYYYLFPFDR